MKPTYIDPEIAVTCVRIEAVGGAVLRFALYPHDLVMSNGTRYLATPFMEPSDISGAENLAPSVFDASGYFSDAGITRDQVLSGVLDNARGYAFKTTWSAPQEDQQPAKKTLFGKTNTEDDLFVIENMGLMDALNSSTGSTVNSKCTHVLFDETIDGDIIATDRSSCTGPRGYSPNRQDGPILADYLISGAVVTDVTSQKAFTASGLAQAAGYFDYGSLLWKTGANAGLRSFEVKQHEAGGIITQHLATHYPIAVGDTFDIHPGCDHTLSGDCINKFGNAPNSLAYEHLITEETYGDYSL